MAFRALLYLGQTSSKCNFTNIQFHQPRIQIQTSWRNSRGFKRNRDESKQTKSIFSRVAAKGETENTTKLWKALGFTIAFSGGTMVVASIWEYERMRRNNQLIVHQYQSLTQRRSGRSGWRADAERWWKSLTDGQRTFAPIFFLNALVFLAWRVPALNGTMLKYFCSNPAATAIGWPMLFSIFSHHSALHLALNMYVLHSFSSIAVASLGKEQFVTLYLTSGVVSSFASNLYKTAFARPGLSLGASGAIMGILSFVCAQYPDSRVAIAFLPMFVFTAGSTIKGLMAIDTVGCILGWRYMDHAAHLGGALFGLFWQAWGSAHIWQKRAPIVRYWHEIRQPPKSN